MNILFLTKSFGIGGVEVVTTTLAKTFVAHGHKVAVFAFYRADNIMEKQLPPDIPLYIGHGFKDCSENVTLLRDLLITRNIDVIINQWGLPFLPIRVINKARKGLGIKVISVYHNQVDTNGKLKACDQAIEKCHNFVFKGLLKIKRGIVRFITSRSMRYVYNHSDIYEVLSPCFVDTFKKFTGIKNPTKLIAQTNPITIENKLTDDNFSLTSLHKKKEIIYVGRLDNVQKRVHRVIDTWSYLEKQFPDWQLTIIGDGDDRQNLEKQVKVLGLERVTFEGFQQPLEYYKRASLLILTSDFEGFGLVIVEGMAYGVVPFVYGSYPAVYDIITDQKDGVIIPFHSNGYNSKEAASLLMEVMSDADKRKAMASAAVEKSKEYSVERIYGEWKKIFENIQ